MLIIRCEQSERGLENRDLVLRWVAGSLGFRLLGSGLCGGITQGITQGIAQ
jgi:hypothetical protein